MRYILPLLAAALLLGGVLPKDFTAQDALQTRSSTPPSSALRAPAYVGTLDPCGVCGRNTCTTYSRLQIRTPYPQAHAALAPLAVLARAREFCHTRSPPYTSKATYPGGFVL